MTAYVLHHHAIEYASPVAFCPLASWRFKALGVIEPKLEKSPSIGNMRGRSASCFYFPSLYVGVVGYRDV